MAEEDKNLEQRLLQIGSLNHIYRGIEKSKSVEERSNLYIGLAGILGEGKEEVKENLYKNIRISPEEAIRYAREGIISRKESIEETYKANKDKIAKKVISSMKNILKKTKNKAEAAQILSNYFVSLFDIPELDQHTADEYARREVEQKAGVSMIFDVNGNKENPEYKMMHETNELSQRILTSEYLKDIKDKDGKITGYILDEEKLSKSMEDALIGSVLYTNSERIEAQIKKAEKKTA